MMPLSSKSKRNLKIPIVASLGGALEFFDFSLFIFMIQPISEAFFPGEPAKVSFYKTLLIFSVGYLIRPIGGLFFGHIGDRWGRKKAFQVSLLLMSISSFLIACIPSVSVIGWFAPLFLLALRLLQGFALGGEIPGAAIFASEHFPEKRGFVTGILFMGITWGMFLTAAIIIILGAIMSPEVFNAYAWRVGFLVGGFSALLVIWLRSSFTEPQIFLDFLPHKREFPIVDLFRFSKLQIFQGICSVALTGGSLFLLVRLGNYVSEYSKVKLADNNYLYLYFFFIYGIFIFLSGWLSDRFGRRRAMVFGCIFGGLGSMLFFYSLPHVSTVFGVYLWLSILAILLSITNGTFACYILERFPTAYRFSGLAFCYNLGFAAFGGFIPLILTSVLAYISSVTVLIVYMAILAVITLMTVFYSEDYHHKHLRF